MSGRSRFWSKRSGWFWPATARRAISDRFGFVQGPPELVRIRQPLRSRIGGGGCGVFGSYVCAGGTWREVDPDAESGVPPEPYLIVMIHDSDIAMIRYSPAGPGTGVAFLGHTPRAYFGDPSASSPTDTAIEAAGLAAWAQVAGSSPAPHAIERYLATDEQDGDAGGVADEDVFVEAKTSRFIQTLGLPKFPQ